ncbi:MAG: 4-oxalocrotonate tautomerase DmpI [Candidatus Odinarchaeota archaeon]
MPIVIVEGPVIDNIEIKRTLVKEITDALEKAYNLPRQTYTVVIKESKPENVGVGGKLVSDS